MKHINSLAPRSELWSGRNSPAFGAAIGQGSQYLSHRAKLFSFEVVKFRPFALVELSLRLDLRTARACMACRQFDCWKSLAWNPFSKKT